MPTTKAEFVQVFNEIRDEFPDAQRIVEFKKPAQGGTYDPVTETTTGGTPAVNETITCISGKFNLTQFDNVQIQVGDQVINALADEFLQFEPRADGVTAVVDGIEHQIVSADTDEMKVMWTMQVRAL